MSIALYSQWLASILTERSGIVMMVVTVMVMVNKENNACWGSNG